MAEIEDIVKCCFHMGFSYDDILSCLAISCGCVISRSTLKRILRRQQLFRRKNHSDLLDVALFMMSTNLQHGYRWMHQKCIQHGFNIPRDTILALLHLLENTGVAARKRKRLRRRTYISKGPNYVWHIDGYDKLKPYGIAIHGCIDGFSRKIIWLEANKTNNDPKVIGNYFINAVKTVQGCPQRVRADMGTENRHVEQIQVFLRENHDDELAGQKSFLYGKSTNNQRIEWLWGMLRKQMCQFWMTLFNSFTMEENSVYCGDFLDKSLIQFCFTHIIQKELDEFAETWNCHQIRTARTPRRAGSRPVTMYTMPGLFDADERLCPADPVKIQLCDEETTPKGQYTCDETVYELSHMVMDVNGWQMPSSSVEGKNLYYNLRTIIKTLL